MKIYYAHCLALYGTPQEDRDMQLLERLFPDAEIVNPGDTAIESFCQAIKSDARNRGADPSQAVMDLIFKPIVQSCDLIIFRGVPGGAVTSGVAKEIAFAQEKQIPILELPSFVGRAMWGKNETRQYLREMGER